MNLLHNNFLSILISLVLIYAVLSILVSIVVEWWNHMRKARGKMLQEAIGKLLSDPINYEYGHLFYGHYMISGLQSDHRPPQYISSTMFAEVLIDVIAKQAEHAQRISTNLNSGAKFKKYEIMGATPPTSVIGRFKVAMDMMDESPFKDVLKSFWDKSAGDYDTMKKLMAAWYDDYMDRVSGWYKSRIQRKLLVAGFVVAIGLNVDSLHLVKILSLDENLRNSLVTTAESVADNYAALADSAKKDANELKKVIDMSIGDSLRKSAEYYKIDSMANNFKTKLQITDSLSLAYIHRADSVIALAASLGIPIGWSKASAPWSWVADNPHECSSGYKAGSGLWSYINSRNNCPSFWKWAKYLIGIIISGFSLSFGAPFWFDLLMKLVNVRRAGKKPQSLTNKKDD